MRKKQTCISLSGDNHTYIHDHFFIGRTNFGGPAICQINWGIMGVIDIGTVSIWRKFHNLRVWCHPFFTFKINFTKLFLFRFFFLEFRNKYIYHHITLQCQVRELDLDFGGSKQKLRLHEMTRCSGQLTDRQGSGQSADSNLAHFRPTKEWSPKTYQKKGMLFQFRLLLH